MDIAAAVNAVLDGLGLFLIGMWLMTDGLKLAAGNTLRDILFTWTNTRARALGTGFMITGLVQSSSAVTVATIGFADAALLSLEQAIWVIFGSNLGTTMTGWIVALVGFKVNMEYLALPLIGIGMILRLTGIHDCVRLLTTMETTRGVSDLDTIENQLKIIEDGYDTLKFTVLKAGSEGRLGIVTVDAQMQQANILRRISRQLVKIAKRLQSVREQVQLLSEEGKSREIEASGQEDATIHTNDDWLNGSKQNP